MASDADSGFPKIVSYAFERYALGLKFKLEHYVIDDGSTGLRKENKYWRRISYKVSSTH